MLRNKHISLDERQQFLNEYTENKLVLQKTQVICMQYHALPALKGYVLPTNTEKGFSVAIEPILRYWKIGFGGMHSEM